MSKELSPREFSRQAQIGLIYTYKLVAGGRIKARKVNDRWLIDSSEVAARRLNSKKWRRNHRHVNNTTTAGENRPK